MRKSNNYNKFLEYIAFGVGGNHGDAVYTDKGVVECVAEARVEDLEGYSKLFNCKYGKMAMDNDTWLKFKVVLVNEEVIEVYYVADSHETHIDTFVLDNFRTQKDVLSTVHQKVVEFFLNSDRFCKLEESSEESSEETIAHDTIETLPPYNDKCFCCPADRPGNRCCGEKWCAETWKRYKAITNPEWHHVSLETLAKIDIDMLDEKRQRYFSIYKKLIKTLNDLHKCKTAATYETRRLRFRQEIADDINYRGTTLYMTRFLDEKISMCNVECGLWLSVNEKATSFIKSRRYCSATLK